MADPLIHETFLSRGGTFVSRCSPWVSCPPTIIARVARDRIAPGDVALPDGWDKSSLDAITAEAGQLGVDVAWSRRQAVELADLGARILDLGRRPAGPVDGSRAGLDPLADHRYRPPA